jgi:AraC family ethanolamine operon transcriptional activator
LQTLRLNSIRRALRSTDKPIIDVAFDHGVTHLGRFSAQYRALFGERPSDTRTGSKGFHDEPALT